MEENESRDILRGRVSSSLLYRFLTVLFICLFSSTVLLSTINNQNTLYPFAPWKLIVFAVVGIALIYFLMRLFGMIPTIRAGIEWPIFGFLFACFVLLQLMVGWSLRIQPDAVSSFGNVYHAAAKFILEKTLPNEYFLLYPRDAGVYAILCGFFTVLRAFGINDFFFPTFLFNTIAIDLAILLLYFSVRYTFGGTKALFTMGLSFFIAPYYLYSPLYCAEAFALPFVVALVFLWQKARKVWRNDDSGGATMYYCILSLVGGAGGFVNPLVLFVWGAISLDMLLYLRGKGRIRRFLAGVFLAMLVFLGTGMMVRESALLPRYNYESDGIPGLHAVYAGLGHSTESYEQDFAHMASIQGKQARYDAAVQGIQRRIEEMGVWGMLRHIGAKLSFLFGDGTYNAPLYLKNNPVQQGFFYNMVYPGQQGFGVLGYTSFVVQISLLFWSLVSAVKSFLRKNDYFSFARNALLGVSLFLLVWQGTSQNLLPFLPLFVLCAVEGGPMGSSAQRKSQIQKLKEELAGAQNPAEEGVPVPFSIPEEAHVPPVSATDAPTVQNLFTVAPKKTQPYMTTMELNTRLLAKEQALQWGSPPGRTPPVNPRQEPPVQQIEMVQEDVAAQPDIPQTQPDEQPYLWPWEREEEQKPAFAIKTVVPTGEHVFFQNTSMPQSPLEEQEDLPIEEPPLPQEAVPPVVQPIQSYYQVQVAPRQYEIKGIVTLQEQGGGGEHTPSVQHVVHFPQQAYHQQTAYTAQQEYPVAPQPQWQQVQKKADPVNLWEYAASHSGVGAFQRRSY